MHTKLTWCHLNTLMLVNVHAHRSIVPLRNAEGAITHHIGMQTFSLVKDQHHTNSGSNAVQQMGGLTGAASIRAYTVRDLDTSQKALMVDMLAHLWPMHAGLLAKSRSCMDLASVADDEPESA